MKKILAITTKEVAWAILMSLKQGLPFGGLFLSPKDNISQSKGNDNQSISNSSQQIDYNKIHVNFLLNMYPNNNDTIPKKISNVNTTILPDDCSIPGNTGDTIAKPNQNTEKLIKKSATTESRTESSFFTNNNSNTQRVNFQRSRFSWIYSRIILLGCVLILVIFSSLSIYAQEGLPLQGETLQAARSHLEGTVSASLDIQGPSFPPIILSPAPSVVPVLDISTPPSSFGSSARVKRKSVVRGLLKKDYKANESLSISIEDEEPEKITIRVLDSKGDTANVKMRTERIDNLITYEIIPPGSIVPGRYTILVTDSDGKVTERNFSWGVLAVNTTKSIYLPNEKVRFAMAVLDEAGNTVCDADLKLEISQPSSPRHSGDQAKPETPESEGDSGRASLARMTTLSTQDRTISVSKECNIKDTKSKADYEAIYQAGDAGKYDYTLTAETKNGEFSITDSFEVREKIAFDIERDTATRIWPLKNYPVKINITANEDFDGVITEIVPNSFEVFQLTQGETLQGCKVSPCENILPYQRVKTVEPHLFDLEDQIYQVPQLGMPFDGVYPITSGFGDQLEGEDQKELYHSFGLNGHDGVDFALPMLARVTSVDEGRVIYVDDAIYGNTVVVAHNWGQSYYGHLSSFKVKKDQVVTKGEVLGFSGSTGISTGPHLHFGIRPNRFDRKNGFFGKINPLPYLGLTDPAQVTVGFGNEVAVKVIYWDVKMKKGETTTLGYSYDSPDASPQFYLLGPLTLQGETLQPCKVSPCRETFVELRQWQVAADAIGDAGIEQQINIIDKAVSAPAGPNWGIVLIDTTKYAAATYYFEVVAKLTSGTGTAVLTYNAGTGNAPSGGTDVTISNINSTSYARYRSASFSPSNSGGLGQNAYLSYISGTGITVDSARIIIVQSDPTKITDTETQAEVGSSETTTSTSMTALTNPKYFKYDDSKFDGTRTASFEATMTSGQGSATPQGPNSVTASGDCTNVADGTNVDWTNPGNAFSQNNTYATATVDGTTTDRDQCVNYGFSIPSNATIVGVVLEADIHASAANNGGVDDAKIMLVLGGTAQGNDNDRGTTDWPTTDTDAYVSWGSSSDKWGLSLTPTNVNAADFGSSIEATKVSGAGAGIEARIDHQRLTVYYTAPQAVTAELYNRTDAATVTGSTVTLTSGTPSRVRSTPLTTNWDTVNADEYEVRLQTAGGTASISAAKVIIDQTSATTGISKLETYHQYINTNVTNVITGDIDTFATTSQAQLRRILDDHTTITSTIGGTNYVYVLGGSSGSTRQSTAYKATIDGTANIGTFDTTSQAQLPQGLYDHTTITSTIGGTNYVYVLGGIGGALGTTQSTLYKATIDGTANIGAFDTTSQAQLLESRSSHTTITLTIGGINNVYVLGGTGGAVSSGKSTVYKATIDGSANIGVFATTSQAQLLQILRNHTTITSTIGGTNYVYVLGGNTASSVRVSTVYKATIDGSANIGVFATTSQAQLLQILDDHTTITSTIGGTNYVYVLGGSTGTRQSTVYKATIDGSANIGVFATTSQAQLPQILNLHSTITSAIGGINNVYVLGGNVGSQVSTVYKAQLDPFTAAGFPNLYDSGSWTGGTFSYFHEGTLQAAASGLTGTARLTPGALGSISSANYGEYGNMGVFATTSQAQLPAIRQEHTTIASTIGGTNYVYVLGGLGSGNIVQSTVYKATIDGSANIGTFATTSQAQLPQILSNLTSITQTIGGTNYVYVLGGKVVAFDEKSTVYKATIDSSANIGTFATTSQAQLREILRDHTIITQTIGGTNYVYVLGGFDGVDRLSTLYKASIDVSANIGAFATTSQAQLPQPLNFHTTMASTIGGTNYVYLLGGIGTDGATRSTVYKATINDSANIGTFATTSQAQLPQKLSNLTSITQTIRGTNYAYVLGGNVYSTVYKATINDSANIGTFATTSQAQLREILRDHTIITQTIGGTNYVYVLGGNSGSSVSTVYRVQLSTKAYELVRSSALTPISSSDIGTFSTTSQSQLPEVLDTHTTITSTIGGTNYVYVLGGFGASVRQSTVYKATIDSSANIGTFATTSQAQLPEVLNTHTTITSTIGGTNYVYVLGGFGASVRQSTVYKATIDSSANIGAFATTSQAQLLQILDTHTTITSTIGGTNYVYVLGGSTAILVRVSTVYKATIDGSANIGAFATTSQAQLLQILDGHTTITSTIGGTSYVYVLGGFGASVRQSTVYKATIDSSANIGTFATTSQAQLLQILDTHTTITSTIGGTNYVYVLGGSNTARQSTVYKATIDSSANIGTFATTSQAQLLQILDGHTTITSTIGGTSYVYVLGGFGASVRQSTVYKANLGGQEYDTETQTADINSSWLVITATNLPTAGGAATPTLSQLMRHGKWFSSGAEQPFTF